MRNKISIALIFMFLSISVMSQDKWDLEKCINYAIENNINIKQKELAKDNSELALKTSKMSRLPDLNANLGQGFNFGLSPTSQGVLVSNNASNTSLSVSTGITVFNGLRINNQIKSDKFNFMASLEDLNQAKEDISLNITSYYLQILLNKELYKIALEKVELSKNQVEKARILFENGRYAESELAESEATLAADELSVTQSFNTLRLSVLDLAQLLELTDVASFDIMEPDIESLMEVDIQDLTNADSAYMTSLQIRPMIKGAELRLDKSKRDLKIAKSYYYPSIGFNASYSNGYYHYFTANDLVRNNSFVDQIKANNTGVLSLSLNVPIFNKMAYKYNVNSAKIGIQNQALELEGTKKALLKDIQQAYYNAVASIKQFKSSEKALESASLAFKFAQEKFNAGSSTSFEFNDAKNRLITTQSQLVQSQYEYIFRCTILDYYNGRPISL